MKGRRMYVIQIVAICLTCLIWDTQAFRQGISQRSDVYIAGFFPYGNGVENSETGRGVMPSVKLALDHVNEHSSILTNYRLHMWWNDTECNAAVGVKSFFDMMHSGPHKLMLFGAACTHVTDPIAKASKHWHLTQLSYADTHPMFTKDAFPNFFRVVPSENAFNAPRLALLREFNWTRIGTIYQNEPRYSLPHNHMVADLDAMGFDVVETQSFVADVRESLQKLVDKDVRIILGNFNEHWARHVFCEAHRLNMFGRSYQWLIMGTYSEHWWNTTATECDTIDMARALEATIMTDLLPLSTSGDITVSGITAAEYLSEYNSRRGEEYSRFHGYTYDGIWAAALAIQYVADRRENFLGTFEYRVKDWENIFLEALKNTSFEGVTGPVRFYNNERRANIMLKQFQNGREEKIGEYNSLQDRLDFAPGKPIKWSGHQPPKDRTLRIIQHSQVNLTIYSILVVLSLAGIVMAIVFLGFNIRFRNQRYIKMSSPHLNNLIIIGCILTYTSVIFLGLDSGLSNVSMFPYICTTRAWLLMAGFSLAFGAMFSKTWRVHSIFTDVKLNKKVIKDYQLFMVVGILLTIDVVIMTTWQIADPFYRDIKYIEPVSDNSASMDDVIIVQENEYCQSERITIFISVIYAYKGLLLVFGAFLAWETRHVSIPALNDSKHIGLSVYNVLIMCIMGAAIALVLSDHKDAVFLLISIFILFCTSGTLCLVFVPKLVEMHRNPQGQVDKRVRATLRPMSKNRRDSSVSELEQRLRDVKTNNCRFRKTLMEKEAELQALVRKIGTDSLNWMEGISCGDSEPLLNTQSKLSVPICRREAASTTEITELTSVGSMTSTYAEHENGTLTTDSRCHNSQMANTVDVLSQLPNLVPPVETPPQAATNIMKTPVAETLVSKQQSDDEDTIYPIKENQKIENHFIKNKNIQPNATNLHKDNESNTSINHRRGSNYAQINTTSKTHSNSELNICPHGKGSTTIDLNHAVDQRRVSVGASLKNNFVVSQSDLWDTHTLSQAKQRQSPRHHSQLQRCQEHGHYSQSTADTPTNNFNSTNVTPIQRSVSEKNRSKHRHKSAVKQLMGQSETDSEREREQPTILGGSVGERQVSERSAPSNGAVNHHSRKLHKSMQHSHHHSTPNVAPGSDRRKYRHKTAHTDEVSNLYGASSESELIDGDKAILPIFQKLLTEREPRYRHSGSRSNGVGASCPNISIKCDIVEYL